MMVKEFTKQGICAYLAIQKFPHKPVFEMRKIKKLENCEQKNYAAKLEHFRQNYCGQCSYYDPPIHYFYFCGNFENQYGMSIKRLDVEDESLVLEVLGGDKKSRTIMTKNDEGMIEPITLERVIESAEQFKKQLEVFNNSHQKPDWDLVRVLAASAQDIYFRQIEESNRLLGGAINDHIIRKNVTKLSEDSYELKKKYDICPDANKIIRVVSIRAGSFGLVAEKMKSEKTDARVAMEFANEINHAIVDALFRGELKTHAPKTGYIRDYNPDGFDENLLYLHEIKVVLEKAGINDLPENLACIFEQKNFLITPPKNVEVPNNHSANIMSVQKAYNKEKLEELLMSICNTEDPHKEIETWTKEAWHILDVFIEKKDWSVEEFSSLICFLDFRQILVEKYRLGKSSKELALGMLNRYSILCEQLFSFFEKTSALPMVKWIEFSEKNSESILLLGDISFSEPIKNKIKFSYFGLDWRNSEEPFLPAGLTYTAKKSAEYLSKKLNREIEGHNVVELCMTNQFDAYIKARKGTESYLAYVAQGVTRFSRKVEDIEAAISSGNVDINYPYTYDGLIKIKKKKRLGIGSNVMTLEHIYQGGSIEIERLTFFECSFADYILGSSHWFEINSNMIGDMISLDDLLFRQEELDNFIAEIIQASNENKLTENIPRENIKTNVSSNGNSKTRSATKALKSRIKNWVKIFVSEKLNENETLPAMQTIAEELEFSGNFQGSHEKTLASSYFLRCFKSQINQGINEALESFHVVYMPKKDWEGLKSDKCIAGKTYFYAENCGKRRLSVKYINSDGDFVSEKLPDSSFLTLNKQALHRLSTIVAEIV